ncbi:MAG: hypothetical protein H6R19_2436, partial [Proteobacteria bacterium]|nr:hypothetical protein [Pseudomonadota bacterium]
MFARLLKPFFHRKPRAAAVSNTQWTAVETRLPCLDHLDERERQDLREMAMMFLDQKVFSGAADFEPDNFARLSIALQACLPVLKLGLEAYAGWHGIIVYPGDFVIPRREVDANGLLHEYTEDA